MLTLPVSGFQGSLPRPLPRGWVLPPPLLLLREGAATPTVPTAAGCSETVKFPG